MYLAQNGVQWQHLVNKVKNLRYALSGFSTSVWLHVIPYVLTDSTGLHTCNIYHKLGPEHWPEVLHRKYTIRISSYIAFMIDTEDTKWHMPVSGVTDW